MSVLKSAWIDLKKSKLSVFIFMSIFFIVPMFAVIMSAALAWISPESMDLGAFILNIVMRVMITIYTSIMSKNMLDIVYKRKLHCFFLSPAIIKVVFAGFLISFLARLYAYGMSFISLPGHSTLNIVIALVSLTLYLCILYFSIRVMFVNQFLLEQNCTILQAVSRSWNITEGRFWLLISFWGAIVGLLLLPFIPLFLVFSYIGLELLILTFINFDISQIDGTFMLIISLLTLVCLFIECYVVYPLIMLMIPHLFKSLTESEEL
jgi:hypothetical protein